MPESFARCTAVLVALWKHVASKSVYLIKEITIMVAMNRLSSLETSPRMLRSLTTTKGLGSEREFARLDCEIPRQEDLQRLLKRLAEKLFNIERMQVAPGKNGLETKLMLSAPRACMQEFRSMHRSWFRNMNPVFRTYDNQLTWTFDLVAPDTPGIAAESLMILEAHGLKAEWVDCFVTPVPGFGGGTFIQDFVVRQTTTSRPDAIEQAKSELENVVGGHASNPVRGARLSEAARY